MKTESPLFPSAGKFVIDRRLIAFIAAFCMLLALIFFLTGAGDPLHGLLRDDVPVLAFGAFFCALWDLCVLLYGCFNQKWYFGLPALFLFFGVLAPIGGLDEPDLGLFLFGRFVVGCVNVLYMILAEFLLFPMIERKNEK